MKNATDEKPLEGTVLEPGVTTTIAEYSKTAVALAEMEKLYKDKTYDVVTTEGMKQAVQARAFIRRHRTDLEKMRKDLKAPALDLSRRIDAEAKTITERLENLEDPIDAQIKAEEARKEEEKQKVIDDNNKRMAAIQEVIAEIKNRPITTSGQSSEAVKAVLELTQSIVIGAEHFEEFQIEAQMAREIAVIGLTKLYDETVKREEEKAQIERDRAELAKLQEAQRARDAEAEEKRRKDEEQRKIDEARVAELQEKERQRLADEREKFEKEKKDDEERQALERTRVQKIQGKLDAIRTYHLNAVGKTAAEIEKMVDEYKSMIVDSATFQEFSQEANSLKETTISTLCRYHAAAVEREEAAQRQAEEKKEQDRIAREQEDERRRQQEEADRLENQRKEQEAHELMLAERRNRLQLEKRGSAIVALQDILSLAEDIVGNPDHHATRMLIGVIAEANIPKAKKAQQ